MNVGVNGKGNPETNKVGHKTQNEDKKNGKLHFFLNHPHTEQLEKIAP